MNDIHAYRLTPAFSVAMVVGLLALSCSAVRPTGSTTASMQAGESLYGSACAACHGADGRGRSATHVGFDVPLPDFTSCTFATREPDADWIAIAHQGGPVRGFSRFMPAFGDALAMDELQLIMDHIRTFCSDDAWPRGELNLPRPLVTEKAYPEDEAVIASTINTEGAGSVMSEIVYEKRFGARNQIEIKVPFGFHESEPGSWRGASLGDVAVGVKRALAHSHRSGSILSATAELILPTGDDELGFGKGTPVAEPFLAFGQILPADAFIHLQGGVEIPFDDSKAENEAFFRGVVGKSFTSGPWGRTWSPMVELLGSTELESGAPIAWDIVPQMQVTLNTRQHVMMNVGLRLPIDDPGRTTQLAVYLLWDWFDGGFAEGW